MRYDKKLSDLILTLSMVSFVAASGLAGVFIHWLPPLTESQKVSICLQAGVLGWVFACVAASTAAGVDIRPSDAAFNAGMLCALWYLSLGLRAGCTDFIQLVSYQVLGGFTGLIAHYIMRGSRP
jgi:hypothetical protein